MGAGPGVPRLALTVPTDARVLAALGIGAAVAVTLLAIGAVLDAWDRITRTA